MKIRYLFATFILAVIVVILVGRFGLAGRAQTDQQQKREALYRLNNLGVAYMEQYKHEDATREFKRALETAPDFAIARINLALAYYFLNDSRNAIAEAREALKLTPDSPQANYALGATLKKERQYEEALASFNKIVRLDPKEPVTNIQIGQVYSQLQRSEEAIAAFRRALASEPFNATAAYSLAQALIRAGKTAEGREMLALFQKLRATGYATILGLNYGEQGRFAEAVTSTGAEPDLISRDATPVRFVDANAGIITRVTSLPLSSILGKRLTRAEFDNDQTRRQIINALSVSLSMGDYDGDHRLDLLITGTDANARPIARLLHNDGGKFTDVTERARITFPSQAAGAVFGDFDNDGKTDIVVFGFQMLALFRNNGDGTFADITARSGLPANYGLWAMTAAWVDADHDGDLDLFVGNFADLGKWPGGDAAVFPDDFPGQGNKLYRNNGNSTFTDISEQAGLRGGDRKTTAVVCTDFNNSRDIDLFVTNYGTPAQLYSNARDGSFKEVASEVGLSDAGKTLGVGAGDLNKDGYTDFYLPHSDGRDSLFLSDGRGGFVKSETRDEGGSLAAQILDYDNDGVLDVVTLGRGGVSLRRGLGASLADPVVVTSVKPASARALSMGDLGDDGAADLLAIGSDGAVGAWRSEGAAKNFVRLTLNGKTSNRSSVGTKVELRSGSLAQKLEVYSSSPAAAAAGITFGLGFRTAVDAVRLYWPAGILQSELAIKTSTDNSIEELDRKGTSCPLLYAWNGSEFSFVTDFLGGSAIGYMTAPGKYEYPDTDEYVRVTGEQLRERDGVYSIRMNNQLEEVIYFDSVKLLAVDHPAETDIYPNERLLPGPPFPEFKIYTVQSPRVPVSAVDDHGNDVRPQITKIDRKYPEEFEKLRFKGYASEHSLTLDLGDVTRAKRVLLLLTAWIDYADSTSNLAAVQAGATLVPPYLQVKNARGEWQTVIPQMGFPAGLPKTMTVDLTGKFLCGDTHVRIVTSMCIYWDQILVDGTGGDFPVRRTELEPLRADLRWRGFPREYSPDGRPPFLYNYREIDAAAPWKAHLGNYTRYGDVRELLLAIDDVYVITRNGDEMQVDFDARALPTLATGWKRDFLVFADGFGKDMDINSARPETIGELPFHAMKSYPFSAGDRYPDTERHRKYLELYNTRTVGRQDQAWRGMK